ETEVVAISLGPQKALDSLRKALAMGADRAVLVSDDAAAGSDLLATSRLLAAALEREEADLVLFGQQASDADGAVLWAAVAGRLPDDGACAGRPAGARRCPQDRGRRECRAGDHRLHRREEADLMPTLVFLEHHGDELQKGALGVLAKAASLGDGDVGAVIAGP